MPCLLPVRTMAEGVGEDCSRGRKVDRPLVVPKKFVAKICGGRG